MSEWRGRAALGAALVFGSASALSGLANSALAQADDEVIVDPELAAPTPARRATKPSRGTSAQSGAGDQVIVDPELGEGGPAPDNDVAAAWGEVEEIDPGGAGSASEPAPVADSYDPQANTGIARIEAIGQFGADLKHEGDLEDAYETRLRFDAEVEFRRSRKLRLSVGLRTDLLWALPAGDDPALSASASGREFNQLPARSYSAFEQDRFELDLLPLSAFIDATPASGFHLRIGVQQVSLGRMDFYSPNDMVAAYDLRVQPRMTPNANKLAQPAVRVDWDLGSWATLQVVYLPWHMPNLTRPSRDRFVARALGTGGGDARAQLEDLVDPGFQTKATESSVRFVGPAPDFRTPQAQARLNMRGQGFELALTGGTALEKLPSIYMTPAAEKYARLQSASAGERMRLSDEQADIALFGLIDNNLPVADVAYHRYHQIGLDGSVDVSPFSLGFELAFSPSRHLVAATHDAAHLPQPNTSVPIRDPVAGDRSMVPDRGNVLDKNIRRGVPLLQAALHLEYLKGEELVVGAEAFVVKTFSLPYDIDRDWWGFIPGKGMFIGGLIGASYKPNPDANRWRFDMSLVGLVGPSLIVMPQVEYRIDDALFVSIAAQFFEGPQLEQLGGAQNVSLGSLYSGYDQVLLGFRYLP